LSAPPQRRFKQRTVLSCFVSAFAPAPRPRSLLP